MNKEIKIIKDNLIYENKYGKLYDDDVVFLPKNVEGKYVRWRWKSPYSVAILPLLNSKQAVLVNIFRHSARKNVLEAPKGFGEKDREPITIAQEELENEIGLVSTNVVYTGKVVTDPSFSYHPMHLFIANDCTKGTSKHEPSEVIIGSEIIEIADVPELLENKAIEDTVTLLLLMLAHSS